MTMAPGSSSLPLAVAVLALVLLAGSAVAIRAGDITCAPCTLSVCAAVACPPADPYVCTVGSSAGGCSPSSDAWTNTSLCLACCDLSGCPPRTPAPSGPAPNVTCGPCTPQQCATTACSSQVPYECVAGNSSGGCAASPSDWSNKVLCSACCDTSTCAGPPPTPAPSGLPCGQCSTAMCRNALRCATVTPFMCTGGPAQFGCTTNATYWPATPATCSTCCDVRTCVQPCAARCTAAQCSRSQCNTVNPFLCTAGPLTNGCAIDPNYFPNQSQCYTCCDTRSCA